ncbi:MAG: serine hydrolase [Armatimonadetes bacterium]|nr:serine hydrolase [Armatimonadota bacterium]
MRRLAIFLMLLFLVPAFQLWNYQVYQQAELERHTGNPRTVEDQALRGSLLDRRGTELAVTRASGRRYPLGAAAGPLLGYLHRRLGAGGLENFEDVQLRGRGAPRTLEEAMELLRTGDRRGNDVVLTIDAELQRRAFEAMAGRRGAVVVLDIPTGEVLAAVSEPSYDPARLEKEWESLIKDPHAPLVERSTQGLYPPGSSFKVLVMAAALAEGAASPTDSITCTGSTWVDGFQLFDSSGTHGRIALPEALVFSCNVTFAELGVELGIDKIRSWMKRLKLLEAPAGVPGANPGHPPSSQGGQVAAAQAAIGQANMLITPLAMARLAALIARGGEDAPPLLVRAVVRKGQVVQRFHSQASRLIEERYVLPVAESMRKVVVRGTGTSAALPGVAVAGKTGTAENPHGPPHSWFIGFAPAEDPQVAVAVILENQGYGGVHAAPLAAEAIRAALSVRLPIPR